MVDQPVGHGYVVRVQALRRRAVPHDDVRPVVDLVTPLDSSALVGRGAAYVSSPEALQDQRTHHIIAQQAPCSKASHDFR